MYYILILVLIHQFNLHMANWLWYLPLQNDIKTHDITFTSMSIIILYLAIFAHTMTDDCTAVMVMALMLNITMDLPLDISTRLASLSSC